MTTATAEALNDVIGDLLPVDAPEYASVAYIAKEFGITPNSVRRAITDGRLPAIPVVGPEGRRQTAAYAVRPVDAALIWGHKLRRGTKS